MGTWLKHKICKLIVTAAALLLLMMIPAAADGTLPLWAALPAGAALLLAANAACGVLLAPLPKQEAAETPKPAATPLVHRAPLRVAGGRAA